MGNQVDFKRFFYIFVAVAAPIVVMAAGRVAFAKFLPTSLKFEKTAAFVTENASCAGTETEARFWVAIAFFLLLFVCGVAVVTAIYVMFRNLRPRQAAAAIAAAIVIAWIAWKVGIEFGDGFLFAKLGNGLFEKTIGNPSTCGPGLGLLEWFITRSNFAAIVAASFVAVAVGILAPAGLQVAKDENGAPPSKDVIDEMASNYAHKISDLKYLVISSSAVLFVGIVLAKAWLDWPLPFFADGAAAAKANYLKVAKSALTYETLYFVLILMAVFAPMALRLRAAAQALANTDPAIGQDEASQKRWLSSHGISLSIGEQVQRVIAIAAPFLGGPALDLLKKLSEIGLGTG